MTQGTQEQTLEAVNAMLAAARAAYDAVEAAECRAWELAESLGVTSGEWAHSPYGKALGIALDALEAMTGPDGRRSREMRDAQRAYMDSESVAGWERGIIAADRASTDADVDCPYCSGDGSQHCEHLPPTCHACNGTGAFESECGGGICGDCNGTGTD